MLGGGGDEVSIMPVVYSCGKVSISSLGFFCLLVILLNLLILLFLSLSRILPHSRVFQEEEEEETKII